MVVALGSGAVFACSSSSSNNDTPATGCRLENCGADASAVGFATLKGSCDEVATSYHNGFGSPANKTEPITFEVGNVKIDTKGSFDATARIGSVYGAVPQPLWLAWCHLSRNDGAQQATPCVATSFDLATKQLGVGANGTSALKGEADGGVRELDLTATVDTPRVNPTDDYTSTFYTCTLK